MGALYSTVSDRTNPPCDTKIEKWELCTVLFLTELIHHVTQGEEKKWELCTALFLTELIHHVTQGEEKKWELCTALFLTELINHVTRRREKVGALYSAVSDRTNPPCDKEKRKSGSSVQHCF